MFEALLFSVLVFIVLACDSDAPRALRQIAAGLAVVAVILAVWVR
ncbi:hypothetical protein [Streptomyces sp. NPDC053048]